MQKCMKSKKSGIKHNRIFLFGYCIKIFARSAPLWMIVTFFVEACIGLLQTVAYITTGKIIDAAEMYFNMEVLYSTVLKLLICGAFVYITMDFMRLVLNTSYNILRNKLERDMLEKINIKLKSIMLNNFEQNELYDDIRRAKEAIPPIISITSTIGIFIMAASRLFTLSWYVFFQNPIYVILVILPTIPIIITRMVNGKNLYDFFYKESPQKRECEYIKNYFIHRNFCKETRTLNISTYLRNEWEKRYLSTMKEELFVNYKNCIVYIIMNILKNLIYIVTLLVSIYGLYSENINTGMFILLTSMITTAHSTIEVVFARGGDMANSIKYMGDYLKVLNLNNEYKKEKTPFLSEIELHNISFNYPLNNKAVLKQINLTIRKGEIISIVGRNGSGKTTLSKILSGLYNPTEGEIKYNGRIKKANELLDCTMLFQDFAEYLLSIKENISFGDIDTLDDIPLIKSFMEKVGLSDKYGLEQYVGKEFGGIELSGGEWQKLAIARGLIGQKEFIILDEPASRLDPVSEYKIFNMILCALEGKTGIIITHKMALTKFSDRIIVLEDGKIVEEGSHKELITKDSQYKEMFEKQNKFYQQ